MIEACVRVSCDGVGCATEALIFAGTLVPAGELTAAGWIAIAPKLKGRAPNTGPVESGRTEHFCPCCQEVEAPQ